MAIIGLIGALNVGKVEILKMFVDYVEKGKIDKIEGGVECKIEKKDFRGESEIEIKDGEGISKTITPNKVVFTDIKTGLQHTLLAPGGDRDLSVIRMGLITLSRIARTIICIFSCNESLKEQLKIYDLARYIPKKIHVCLNKYDLLEGTVEEKNKILEEKKEKITNYFKKRRIIVEGFFFTCAIEKPNFLEYNDNIARMILNLAVPGLSLEIKKYQKEYHKYSPRIIQKTVPENLRKSKMSKTKNENQKEYWYNLGNIYKYQKNYQEAIQCYKKALKIDPNYLNVWNNIGYVYRNQKNFQEATRCFRKVLKINPNDVNAEKILNILDNKNLTLKIENQKSLFYDSLRDEELDGNLQKLMEEAKKGIRNKALSTKEDDLSSNDIKLRHSEIGRPPIANNGDKSLMDKINQNMATSLKTRKEVEEIDIKREYEFFNGQIRFKIGVINNSNTVMTDLKVNFMIPMALKWLIYEPDFMRSGDTINIPRLSAKEKISISLYLEPISCMDGKIRASVSYLDAHDELHTTTMKDKMVNVTCPIFFTNQDVNLARVNNLYESLSYKDKKLFSFSSDNIDKIFSLILIVVGSHDVKQVFKELSAEKKKGEAIYFGITKVKKEKMVIKANIDGKNRIIELEVAGNEESSITALLAELENQLRQSFKEKELIKNADKFFDIKTSVRLRICPNCGRDISSVDQIKFDEGEDICCKWCDYLIRKYY